MQQARVAPATTGKCAGAAQLNLPMAVLLRQWRCCPTGKQLAPLQDLAPSALA